MSKGDDIITSAQLKRALLRQARRLGQHIKHIREEEHRQLDELVTQLEELHSNDDACLRARRHYSDLPEPPWGTRYAFWWERAAWWLRRTLSRKG